MSDYPEPTYRPDIDGLRAIAVLLVLGYHAFPEWIKGGFIGVDIFFVISGFLISTILFEGLARGSLKLSEFYARRVRRIFPALIVVLATCAVAGWFLLFAHEYKALGKYIAGGAGFVANLFFLHDGGYFGGAATSKPLLHLWSLGVEEQFYLLWPCLLWVTWRVNLSHKLIIFLLFAGSFLWATVPVFFSSLGLENALSFGSLNLLLRTDSLASFFLPQARFWELLTGAALASAHLQQVLSVWFARAISCNAISYIGGGLVLLGLLLIRDDMGYPGFWGLLPTFGAALLIASGARGTVNRYVLSAKALIAIGRISYPLYLWHWPLLVFSYLALGQTPSAAVRISCLSLSFVLAHGTYRWVEIPMRFGARRTFKTILLLMGMGISGIAGVWIYREQGIPMRAFALQTQTISQAAADWVFPKELQLAEVPGVETQEGAQIYKNMDGMPRILVVGDSHVQQYAHRIAQIGTKRGLPVMFLTGGGCPAIPGVISQTHYHCRKMMEHFEALLKKYSSIQTVVVGGCWNGIFLDEDYAMADGKLVRDFGKTQALASLKELLVRLQRHHHVYFVLDNPSTDAFDPVTMLGNRLTFKSLSAVPRYVPVPTIQVQLNEELRELGAQAGVTIIDPMAQLCSREGCERIDRTGKPVYQNATHLTAEFVREKADYLDVIFSEYQ